MANKQIPKKEPKMVPASQQFDKTKFSVVEMFLNTNGKTSITKLIGFAASFMCIIMFVVMMIFVVLVSTTGLI